MQIRRSRKGKVYRKASKILVLIKGMFNHETPVAENFTGERENAGAEWRYEHRWCYQPLSKQGPPEPTEEATRPKKKKRKIGRGHLHLPWTLNKEFALEPPCENNRAWRPELSSDDQNHLCHQSCGSQESPEGIICTFCPSPHAQGQEKSLLRSYTGKRSQPGWG